MKRLKLFKSVLTYGIILFFSGCDKENVAVVKVTDADGNVYKTVTIGTQVWMAENLKTTKYNDGTAIPRIVDDLEWKNLSTDAYCWNNNDSSSYASTYGVLYNWYAVNTGKLCPVGWHIPSDAEWTTLTEYLGGEGIAGAKLKEIGTMHWNTPNTSATNESDFTDLPGGLRYNDGSFDFVGNYGYWWSRTEHDYYSEKAWCRSMLYNSSNVSRGSYEKNGGFSVRCIKD